MARGNRDHAGPGVKLQERGCIQAPASQTECHWRSQLSTAVRPWFLCSKVNREADGTGLSREVWELNVATRWQYAEGHGPGVLLQDSGTGKYFGLRDAQVQSKEKAVHFAHSACPHTSMKHQHLVVL